MTFSTRAFKEEAGVEVDGAQAGEGGAAGEREEGGVDGLGGGVRLVSRERRMENG